MSAVPDLSVPAGLGAVEVLQEQADTPGFRLVLDNVIESVRGGSDLSTALEAYPKVFPQIYVSMVRAGEVSGQLDDILVRLAEYLEAHALHRKGTERLADMPLLFEPGARFGYSNSNYVVLGLIIEALCGRWYDEVVRARILHVGFVLGADADVLLTIGRSLQGGHRTGPADQQRCDHRREDHHVAQRQQRQDLQYRRQQRETEH